MEKRPATIKILTLLWLALSGIFLLWGIYSLNIVLQIPSWESDLAGSKATIALLAILHFGYTLSTIVWLVFSSLFIVFSYGTIKGDHWVWSTGLIISTIFLAVFGLMLVSFMVNAILFKVEFSILGLVSVILSLLTDLGIIFYLTRVPSRQFFERNEQKLSIV